jgi:hypothetical protein
VEVEGLTSAISVSVGDEDACALLNTGHIDCWGRNNYGQLGNGSTNQDPNPTPVPVIAITNAIAVSVGNFDACALLSGGGIDCWGYNEDGRLGDGNSESTASPVAVLGFG